MRQSSSSILAILANANANSPCFSQKFSKRQSFTLCRATTQQNPVENNENMNDFVKSLHDKEKHSSIKGRLLDPKDYPELLNDLPGYEVIEVVHEDTGDYIPIFDDPIGVNKRYGDKEHDPYSISSNTLRDISESYGFSMAFLGDFVVQLGANTPIDVDTPISTYVTRVS